MLFLHLVNASTMRNQFLDEYTLHLLLELMMVNTEFLRNYCYVPDSHE